MCLQTSSAMEWGPHMNGDPEPAAKWEWGEECTGGVTRKEEGPVLLDGVQDNSNKAVSLLPC